MQRCDHWRLQRVVYSHACYTCEGIKNMAHKKYRTQSCDSQALSSECRFKRITHRQFKAKIDSLTFT